MSEHASFKAITELITASRLVMCATETHRGNALGIIRELDQFDSIIKGCVQGVYLDLRCGSG